MNPVFIGSKSKAWPRLMQPIDINDHEVCVFLAHYNLKTSNVIEIEFVFTVYFLTNFYTVLAR